MNKTLKAEERKVTGRKVSTLRSSGLIPGNVYGKDIKSVSVQITSEDFGKAYKEVGETGLLELDLGKDKKPVLIHNIQKNPITGEAIHVDFFQVNLKEKVTASIPVELTGEAPAEKLGVGTAVQYVNEIEVEALPTDLLEKFVADISELSEVDQAIYVKDLKYDKAKIEVKVDPEQIVVKVDAPQKEEELPVATETPVEGVEGGEVAPTEGGEAAATQDAGTETPKEEQK